MEQQQAVDIQTKAKSFLQAKWFPGAIASLALVIAIGGHTFTAINSVGYAKMSNRLDALEYFKSLTERSEGAQGHEIQQLQSEVSRLTRANRQLNDKIEALETAKASSKSEPKVVSATYDATVREGLKQSEMAKTETRPLPNGVNERFDNVIRSRMKPYWEEPDTRQGEERMDDDDLVVLEFHVARQGSISDVRVANTSGQIMLDNAMLKAALRMGSIPEIARLNDQAYSKVRSFRLALTPGSMR